MTNTETLKSWGFFEKNGWLCSPKLNGEEVFQVGQIDDKEMSYLIECLTAISFNSGSRWQRTESKKTLINELEKMVKKIEGL